MDRADRITSVVLGARKANCEGLLSVLSHCASAQCGGDISLYRDLAIRFLAAEHGRTVRIEFSLGNVLKGSDCENNHCRGCILDAFIG